MDFEFDSPGTRPSIGFRDHGQKVKSPTDRWTAVTVQKRVDASVRWLVDRCVDLPIPEIVRAFLSQLDCFHTCTRQCSRRYVFPILMSFHDSGTNSSQSLDCILLHRSLTCIPFVVRFYICFSDDAFDSFRRCCRQGVPRGNHQDFIERLHQSKQSFVTDRRSWTTGLAAYTLRGSSPVTVHAQCTQCSAAPANYRSIVAWNNEDTGIAR